MNLIDICSTYILLALATGILGGIYEITIGLPKGIDYIIIIMSILGVVAITYVQLYYTPTENEGEE